MKRKVDVNLLGQQFSVRTERDDAWVHGLASFVGRRFEELRRQARNANAQQLAMLLALNLADELFQQRERSDALASELKTTAADTLERVRRAIEELDGIRDGDSDDEVDEVEEDVEVGAEA